jgi:GNAT superfamily N-acetyltransferase
MIITIREAEKSDVPVIVEIMKGLSIRTSAVETKGGAAHEEYERVFEEIRRDPHHRLFVAEAEGRVVGAADLLIVPNLSHRGLPWAIIENVVVDETMRRKGIGRELVKHLVKIAKESGCYNIKLTSDRKRSAAHRLYESLGFEQYGLAFRIYF